MRTLIADDEPLALQLLRALLDETSGVEVIGVASDAKTLLVTAARLQPDLVMTDIEMPGLTGLQAAQELNRLGSEVVFVTAHHQYAVQAFEAEVADYVLKPLSLERIQNAVERARRRHAARYLASDAREPTTSPQFPLAVGAGPDFWVSSRTGLFRVPIADVRWIEAARDHVFIHTAGRSHMVRVTMTSLEARLSGTGLQRVHRSAFVRLKEVRGVKRRSKGVYLVLCCGTEVPVGASYSDQVLGALEI